MSFFQRFGIALLALLLGASTAFSQPRGQRPASREGIVPGRYIVVLRDEVPEPGSTADRLARRHGLGLRHVYRRALKGFAAAVPEAALQRLRSDPEVAYVEPDRWVHAVAQQIPTGVDRIDADANSTAKIDGIDERVDVDVAVIDTGIDSLHPDLFVVGAADCLQASGCSSVQGSDGHGHGSHVGGIVGALDNDIGVVGMAPGARLWSVRVLDNNGSGFLSWVINGIDWVTARAGTIEVANMSLSWQGYSAAAHTAVRNSVAAGVFYAVAAGNDSRDVYGADGVFGTFDDTSPAAFPEVAAISAFGDGDGKPGGEASASDDSFATFTNFSGSVVANNPVQSPGAAIDLACPGVSILSTFRGGGYAVFSGTSMASPHAAGLAALYIAENGRATDAAGVYDIRQALIDRGVEQSSENGLALSNDPDGNLEKIGWAADLGPRTDIAITSVVAEPSSTTLGGTIVVTVGVRNVGTEDVTGDVTVSLFSDNATPASGDDLSLGQRVIPGGLAPGASTVLSYSWNTGAGSVNFGDHGLLSSHDFPDDEPSNDVRSTTATVNDPSTPASTHVADLDGLRRSTLWWFVWRADVTVTVQDNLGGPVPGAGVNILWSDGSTDALVTNASGQATFIGFQWSWMPSLTLTVTSISHGSLPYDSSLNTDPDGDSDGTSITVNRR